MKKFTTKEIETLSKQIAQGDKDSRYYRRVQAVYWRSQGRNNQEVISLSGFGTTSIVRFCNQFQKYGLEGLRSHYAGPNNRKLSHEEEAAILEKLISGASVGKYVRGVELLKQFEELSGISYHINGFYALIHRHGWRKLMPRGQHPKKANDEAIEASKKLT
jgi:transposase